ncbi:30S ribosomal protein 3, chloroplastic [Telopea speciosissima]|uniref:30S ribosomal protein 3, chloroplastic n=1 Tax=Telopea speciosissima TaxID=54955 RepID=UPI001CC7AFC2|nr:30S ribosomal protein 3, chloroplastic [Telopea speciosissima]
MLSMAIQPGVNGAFTRSCFTPQNLGFKPLKASIIFKPKVSSLHLTTLAEFKSRPNRKGVRLSASAAAIEAFEEETSSVDSASVAPEDSEPVEEKEKLGVVVKTMEKPRLVLKFIWLEKNIGLALDQKIPGHGTIPLSPYYFWPRKDAWEELKSLLESKPWISQKRMIILLNQATDIINLWQQSGGNLS